MAIPNEALQKLVLEIETQAVVAQEQLNQARSQMANKQREQRLVHLTIDELNGLPNEAAVYEGVGKMFVSLPIQSLRRKLKSQTEELTGNIEKLNRRLHYLETTQKNSRDHIEQMLRAR